MVLFSEDRPIIVYGYRCWVDATIKPQHYCDKRGKFISQSRRKGGNAVLRRKCRVIRRGGEGRSVVDRSWMGGMSRRFELTLTLIAGEH